MKLTGYCNIKVINPSQTSFMTYTDTNGQNYSYLLNFPTYSGGYFSTTFNDNNFTLPTGNFTMKVNGWCGNDTVNSFIKKII
jgi:hypothetical protein